MDAPSVDSTVDTWTQRGQWLQLAVIIDCKTIDASMRCFCDADGKLLSDAEADFPEHGAA